MADLLALAALVDHTLLKPEAQPGDISRLCAEAVAMNFASVCVNPLYVPQTMRELAGSAVKSCTVIGFPLGANQTAIKRAEAERALADGAHELDMVISIGGLKAFGAASVQAEVAELRSLGDYTLKVIIETCLLTQDEIIAACTGAVAGGADFVKTSTGFSTGGARVEDVALMRKTVGPKIGVKASGGVRSLADLEAMVAAGATRIGTGSAMAIFSGVSPATGY